MVLYRAPYKALTLEGPEEYFLWGYDMGLGMSDGRESGHDEDR